MFTHKSQGVKYLLTPPPKQDLKGKITEIVFFFFFLLFLFGKAQVAQVLKNPPSNAEDIRDVGLIPGSRRFSGGRNGNPLQYSCLGNFVDREACQATVQSYIINPNI